MPYESAARKEIKKSDQFSSQNFAICSIISQFFKFSNFHLNCFDTNCFCRKQENAEKSVYGVGAIRIDNYFDRSLYTVSCCCCNFFIFALQSKSNRAVWALGMCVRVFDFNFVLSSRHRPDIFHVFFLLCTNAARLSFVYLLKSNFIWMNHTRDLSVWLNGVNHMRNIK